MLTTATRVKLAVFALLSVLVVVYTGVHYANLGRYVGLSGYYVVRLDLAQAGGIFPDAEILITGVEDPDTRAHGANESLHLATFERACLAEALLLRNIAETA